MNPSINIFCIVCGSNIFKSYLKILKKCESCGHVVADYDPESFSSHLIYDDNFFDKGAYFNYLGDQKCYEYNFTKRLNSISKYCQQGSLLEIGSAYGFFLNLASKYFQTTGYEISPKAAEYARTHFKLNIKSDDFLTDHIPDESFDIVVMWDVIEHLPNPQDFIQKIYRVLKKNGILALTTGDINSFMARLQGVHWRLIHPPIHLHYFSKQSLTNLLQKFNFDVLEVSYPGFWRSLGQMVYGIVDPKNEIKKMNSPNKYFSSVERIPIYLNLFDIMQVISHKKP